MAAVEVTISGVLFDKLNRTTQQVVLIGEATLTGLGVGGGPIIPPPFDPNAPRPSHPIALPGDPWWGHDLKPTHPIVIPPPPIDPPPGNGTDDGVVKPPPPTGGWGYVKPYGWAWFPMGSGAGPHK